MMFTLESAPMGCVEKLAGLALRRFALRSHQLISAGEGGAPAEDFFVQIGHEKVNAALGRALEQTALSLELAIVGQSVSDAVQKAQGRGEEEILRPLPRFLDQIDGDRAVPADRTQVANCRNQLRAALGTAFPPAGGANSLVGFAYFGFGASESDPRDRVNEEWEELARIGEELRRSGSVELAQLLELRGPGQEPLVVALIAEFLAKDLDGPADGVTNGLASSNERMLELGDTTFRELVDALDQQRTKLTNILDSLFESTVAVNSEECATRLQRAQAHIQRGEYERAIGEFTGAMRFDRGHAELFIQRGDAYRLNGDYKNALEDYSEAHRLDPANARLLFNRGVVHWLVGDAAAAISDYSKALQFGPATAVLHANRGQAYAEYGDRDAALADFDHAIQLDPSYALAYQRRGDLHYRQGDYDRAVSDYTQVLRLNPFCALTHVRRGDTHSAQGEFDRAVADYTNALQVDPLHLAAHVNRGQTYLVLNRHDLALADLANALRLGGENHEIYHQRALCHRCLQNYGAALADFDKALHLRPDDVTLHYDRGCTHQLIENLDAALADFTMAVRLKPDFAVAHMSKGSVHVSRKEVDLAIVSFGAAIKADPNLAQAYLKRATAWAKKGRLDETIRDCGNALRRDRELAGAHLVRGIALAQQGAYSEANADFERVLELEPDNAHVYQVRGSNAMKQGEYEKALVDLSESLRLKPDNARTHYLRGLVHQFLDHQDTALADLNQAVLLDPQYTAAYCNQRALLHAASQQFELALADYAIVLQLDRTNLTALIGREQVLQAMKAGPPLPKAPAAKTAPKQQTAPAVETIAVEPLTRHPTKTAEHVPAPATQTYSLNKSASVEWKVDAAHPQPDSPNSLIHPLTDANNESADEEVEITLLNDTIVEVPGIVGETRPDKAVDPPSIKGEFLDISADPEREASGKPVAGPDSPILTRLANKQAERETTNRARIWAEMRYRERLKQNEVQKEEFRQQVAAESDTRITGRMVLIAAAGLAVVLLIGAGVYYAFFAAKSEPQLTAAKAWEEFATDPSAASEKYKGQFVVLTGTVKVQQTEDNTTRVFFAPPDEKAKWVIELPANQAMKDLKDGQEATVRCRFGARKDAEGDLLLSNCTLVTEK